MMDRAIASDIDTTRAATVRPRLRGTVHGGMALLAPALLVGMLLIADGARASVGAAIFGAALIALYTTSASYHLAPWPNRARAVMMRIDHAMVFALIAGTYTPFCLVVLSNAWGITMLSVVWTLAAAGMLMKIAWPHTPRWLSVAMYVGLGWVGVVAAVDVITRMDALPLVMLMAGGALYSLGAVVYAARRPDPWPHMFGYHEVFHVLVVLGTALHLAVIAAYVL